MVETENTDDWIYVFMGSSVIAKCTCGFETPPLMIGGGMMNFMEFCAFPAYCAKGSHLVTVNMFDNPLRCSKRHKAPPVPYIDESLTKERGVKIVAEWNFEDRELELTDGQYFCPSCHEFTMTFIEGGVMWD